MKRKSLGLMASVVVASMVAACSSGTSTDGKTTPSGNGAPVDDAWKQVVDAAKKEKTVTLLHNLRPEGIPDLISAFNKDYPDIQVAETRLGSAQLNERFETETQAGKSATDALITFYDQPMDKWISNGWVLQWEPLEFKAYTKDFTRDSKFFWVNTAREALIYNKTKVKAEEAPKDWKDLFDPKWKGKIGMNQPWRSVSIQQVIAHWEKDLGMKDTDKLMKDQGVKFYNGSAGVLQAVQTGEVLVAEITDLPVEPAMEQGQPIGVYYPASGTPISIGYAMVPAKAPNSNAGKVFVNWLLSEKGQIALQKSGGLPGTRPGIPAPQFVPATKDLKVVDGTKILTPDYQNEMLNRWKSTFGVK